MRRFLLNVMLACLIAMVAQQALASQAAGEGGTDLELAAQSVVSSGKSTVRTAPRQDIESRADRERKYRSCLFSYLPRVGSDVAAELIRDACKAEYMP